MITLSALCLLVISSLMFAEPVYSREEHDYEGSWTALGSGTNSRVQAVAVSGSDVYAGGQFTQAGGNTAMFIALWDGSSWSTLGGVNNFVNDIVVSGSDVYVGGRFTQAGGNPANYIARWDGSSWHALGSGLNDPVRSIAVSGSDVYVGGTFTQAGGIPASYIARWDGSSWHALGSGVNGWVYSIAVNGADVYAGGLFTHAGGNPASRIARWDGSSWSPLGSGVDGEGQYTTVLEIIVNDTELLVGGIFRLAGGNPANYIARWDGSSWSTFGSGLDQYAAAIALSGSDMYVGGYFTQAGGNPVNHIACWVEDPTGIEPPSEETAQSLCAFPNPFTVGVNLTFQSIGSSPMTLEVFDITGRQVWAHELGTLPAGGHTCYWDGRDGSGSALASGLYLVRLHSSEFQASTRVVLVR